MTWNTAQTICTERTGRRWLRNPHTNRMTVIGEAAEPAPKAAAPSPRKPRASKTGDLFG